jgi:hypothetical protein
LDVHATQVLPEHIGLSPLQVALLRHCTQVFVAVLQRGVAPTQALVFVAVQLTQPPPLVHAGTLLPFRALHSVSPVVGGLPCVHPRQLKLVASQIG